MKLTLYQKVLGIYLLSLPLVGLLIAAMIIVLMFGSEPLQAQIPTATIANTPFPTLDIPDDLPEPEGCLRPPDDYTRVTVNGSVLSQRTVAMLAHAEMLYGGTIDVDGLAVTQGSYNAGGVALSFGTHDAGGAVDISVRNIPRSYAILWDDIPLVIEALRLAGFAAWYRDEADEMSPHIHAIAIGDGELSRAARLQLDGRYGYFRGFDGLPQVDGVPQLDDSGDLIVCNWMRELGFEDFRDEVEISEPPYTIAIGDTLYVNTVWGEELNLRSAPGLRNTIVIKMPSELPVTVVDGPQSVDGYTWWMLELEDGTTGWAVEVFDGGMMLVK